MLVPEFHPKHVILIQQGLFLWAIFGLVPEQQDYSDNSFQQSAGQYGLTGRQCVNLSTGQFSKNLRVCVILNIKEVVGHGLVGEFMEDGAYRVKTSFHYQQLGLSLFLQA